VLPLREREFGVVSWTSRCRDGRLHRRRPGAAADRERRAARTRSVIALNANAMTRRPLSGASPPAWTAPSPSRSKRTRCSRPSSERVRTSPRRPPRRPRGCGRGPGGRQGLRARHDGATRSGSGLRRAGGPSSPRPSMWRRDRPRRGRPGVHRRTCRRLPRVRDETVARIRSAPPTRRTSPRPRRRAITQGGVRERPADGREIRRARGRAGGRRTRRGSIRASRS